MLVEITTPVLYFSAYCCLHTVHDRCRRSRVTRLQVNEVSIPSSLVNSCSPRAVSFSVSRQFVIICGRLGVCRRKDASRRFRQRMEQRSFHLHLSTEEVDTKIQEHSSEFHKDEDINPDFSWFRSETRSFHHYRLNLLNRVLMLVRVLSFSIQCSAIFEDSRSSQQHARRHSAEQDIVLLFGRGSESPDSSVHLRCSSS